MIATSRRRLLLVAGGAALLALSTRNRRDSVYTWRSNVLGAETRVMISERSEAEASSIASEIQAEALRLESIFSLYRQESELARLNRDGILRAPSEDFRNLLARSIEGWHRTAGAFNVAIQPYWAALARSLARSGNPPDERETNRLLALADPRRIDLSPSRVRLEAGMALTFNGIAQGYITDAAAHLLERRGLRDILIDLGEVYALPGRPWHIEAGAAGLQNASRRAFATSCGRATPFTSDGRWHHLIDPDTGQSARAVTRVTVASTSATEADLLSTALAVALPARHGAILTRFSGERAYVKVTPS
ncbi:MAG: FAD:protein FMN transferase [Hyphomicrobiales bacterium]